MPIPTRNARVRHARITEDTQELAGLARELRFTGRGSRLLDSRVHAALVQPDVPPHRLEMMRRDEGAQQLPSYTASLDDALQHLPDAAGRLEAAIAELRRKGHGEVPYVEALALEVCRQVAGAHAPARAPAFEIPSSWLGLAERWDPRFHLEVMERVCVRAIDRDDTAQVRKVMAEVAAEGV